MAGIYSQGGSAGHRYAGWLEQVEAKNFQFGGKVFNGSPSAIYVGSNLVWGSSWLSVATQQAILGAFGQRDGWAVINATNAYLDGIAAQGAAGKAKAQALAGFINEDPMMVCSLGLEVEGVTMPIRWLESYDGARCEVYGNGIYVTADTIIEFDFTPKSAFSSASNVFYAFANANGWCNAMTWIACYGNRGSVVTLGFRASRDADLLDIPYVQDKHYVVRLIGNKIYVDEELKKTVSNQTTSSQDGFRCCQSIEATHSKQWYSYVRLSGNVDVELVPCGKMINGVMEYGMLDLKAIGNPNKTVWFGNANSSGSFSVAYTRNGQPWTPSTP